VVVAIPQSDIQILVRGSVTVLTFSAELPGVQLNLNEHGCKGLKGTQPSTAMGNNSYHIVAESASCMAESSLRP